MISKEARSKYTATIGIECHVQLKTKTKLFSAVGNDAREAPPNTLISHIDLGMPGALPVLNEKAVELAVRAAFAMGTKPQKFSKFDRKHYFYPDLPKGYQITQYDEPIIVGGHVDIVLDGKSKRINITRAHLEEDAGKSTHPAGKDYSLVDLNRAGTPLLEIVSEPDMHSAAEAKAFAKELYLLMRYADVSDANLFYGNMRFDVNVSVSKSRKLGIRSETKNLNSFKSVEKAVDYEINRQIELLEKGEEIVQETRGWDDAKQKTLSQRSKEDAHDYRYFPDPDIPPIVLDEKFIKKIESEMPMMPAEWRQKLRALELEPATIEALVENEALLNKLELENLTGEHLRRVANWLVNVVLGELNKRQINIDNPDNFLPHAGSLKKLSEMVASGKLSNTAAEAILASDFTNLGDPEVLTKEKNLLQVSDEGEIQQIVEKVLAENSKAAEDVKNGEMKAVGFLVGQVMKESKGKANPGLAQKLIKKTLQ